MAHRRLSSRPPSAQLVQALTSALKTAHLSEQQAAPSAPPPPPGALSAPRPPPPAGQPSYADGRRLLEVIAPLCLRPALKGAFNQRALFKVLGQ